MTTPLPLRPSVPAADGWVALSGQIGLRDQLLVDGARGQTRQALRNLERVLVEHAMSLCDIVKLNVYLTDMSDYAAMNVAYAEVFHENPPARSAIAVRGLPLGAVVEIEGWAFKRQDDTTTV